MEEGRGSNQLLLSMYREPGLTMFTFNSGVMRILSIRGDLFWLEFLVYKGLPIELASHSLAGVQSPPRSISETNLFPKPQRADF